MLLSLVNCILFMRNDMSNQSARKVIKSEAFTMYIPQPIFHYLYSPYMFVAGKKLTVLGE